ncbi:MAG: arylsulfatase [Haliscomenobacter sp.]|nr:arylsulfatase [Haliscomenobacter sp.]
MHFFLTNIRYGKAPFIAWLSLAAWLPCHGQKAALSPLTGARPNIIFILADDLGYADLGCYGQRAIQTPNIDRLAAEGMRFTQAYAGSTVCAPSRSVLMTGKHTGHTTVRGNNGVGGVVGLEGLPGRIPLLEEDTTLAEVLRAAGYRTGMTGKWGLGEPATSGHPNAQGFEEFYGFLNQRRAHSYYPDYIWKDTSKVFVTGNQNGGRGQYIHDAFTEFALGFLDRHRESPFLLFLPYTAPHERFEVPELGPYADSLHWTEDERIYAAMVTRLDRDVGILMQKLDALGLSENTLVVFCSDNGPAFLWKDRFDSAGRFRGFKRDLYEGGIRVPMIVRYPGKIPAGAVSGLPWYFGDVLPTLAALAGAQTPGGLDGENILPAFTLQKPDKAVFNRAFYWEFHERGFQQAVRWKDWKGVKLAPDSLWELYNLRLDPFERQNLAARYPKVVKKLAEIASREHVPSPFFPVPGDAEGNYSLDAGFPLRFDFGYGGTKKEDIRMLPPSFDPVKPIQYEGFMFRMSPLLAGIKPPGNECPSFFCNRLLN